VTELITPPRIVQLRTRHKDRIPLTSIDDSAKALEGNGFHSMMERWLYRSPRKSEFLNEFRVFDKIHGRKVVGKLDVFHKPSGTLYDYKSTSIYKAMFGDVEDFENQLNIYAWFMSQEGYDVNAIKVIFWHFMWDKFQMMRDPKYPRHKYHEIDIPLWTLEEREEFLFSKVRQHVAAESLADDDLPYCTPSEMWEKDTKYAIMEPGAKRAARVLDTPEDLEKYAEWKETSGKPLKKGWKIEERPGTRMRCEQFCSCNVFCNQYAEWQGAC